MTPTKQEIPEELEQLNNPSVLKPRMYSFDEVKALLAKERQEIVEGLEGQQKLALHEPSGCECGGDTRGCEIQAYNEGNSDAIFLIKKRI